MDDFLWTADKSLVKFHASSLNLFHSLCFGRNRLEDFYGFKKKTAPLSYIPIPSSSIQEVRKLVSGEEALSGLMCKGLPLI